METLQCIAQTTCFVLTRSVNRKKSFEGQDFTISLSVLGCQASEMKVVLLYLSTSSTVNTNRLLIDGHTDKIFCLHNYIFYLPDRTADSCPKLLMPVNFIIIKNRMRLQ